MKIDVKYCQKIIFFALRKVLLQQFTGDVAYL